MFHYRSPFDSPTNKKIARWQKPPGNFGPEESRTPGLCNLPRQAQRSMAALWTGLAAIFGGSYRHDLDHKKSGPEEN